jgi:hypothetical protein
MGEIDRYRERMEAARRDVAALPSTGPTRLGPPDERTGERWDRTNVLGHMAEMLPYWTEQIRAVLAGATEMGRDEAGHAARQRAVDGGREVGEADLVRRIDAGAGKVLTLLSDLREPDLDRKVTYHAADTGDRVVDLRYAFESVLLGHLEAHVRQIKELG